MSSIVSQQMNKLQKNNEFKKSNQLFCESQKNYLKYLASLLPLSFISFNQHGKYNYNKQKMPFQNSLTDLRIFDQKVYKQDMKLKKSKNYQIITRSLNQLYPTFEQFILNIVKNISILKTLQQYGQHQPLMRQLGIDIKTLNKIQTQQCKIGFMMNSINKGIQQQKKKILNPKSYNSNLQDSTNLQTFNVKTIHKVKINNSSKNIEMNKKGISVYQQFIKQQNKKQVDNFSWLQINTKYPMLQKKLKSKLIQTINQDKNQKRIRQLIDKKQNNSKNSQQINKINNTSVFDKQSNQIDDQKIQLINQSLVVQDYDKTKIQYVWTQSDQKMFAQNIKQLKKKCSKNRDILKLSGRNKFITQGQFETLACQQISRMLNKNNKIYLSRQFLLDKYFSSKQILTQQQMRFILKTSPMLSKCVDKNFIKSAIKNIKYQNISDLQLKIAQDIIMKFQKLRNTVRASRKMHKQLTNKTTKQRIVQFQNNKQIQIARQIARQQLKKHKVYLKRSINYENRQPGLKNKKINYGHIENSNKKKSHNNNIWTPLNKFHPSTGLFVKDCNQQCTDDLFNSYEIDYLKKINNQKQVPKKNMSTKYQMIKFYTGGPDQNINQNFNQQTIDIQRICQIIKASYFQKKIITALQSIQIHTTRRQLITMGTQLKLSRSDIKTRKIQDSGCQQQYELIAKKRLMQTKQDKYKSKVTVYVNKLLNLAAQNSYKNIKALNPVFSVQQVNTKDKKGNTALYYAAKFGNQQFSDYLLKLGSNPNIQCQKKNSPTHLAFKSNRITLILRFLTYNANLNLINNDYKTPIAYCSRDILKRLNLQQGIASIDPNLPTFNFDNNVLLQKQNIDRIKEDYLQIQNQITKNINNKYEKKLSTKIQSQLGKTITSIQNLHQ